MRAQVCSAAGEAAIARSRFDEAKGEFEEALRLAYEVGAYAEAPFLIARLGEIAYRSGEPDAARKLLAEASGEADRYGVPDPQAYVHLLNALMAVEDGEVARARALCDEAARESSRGTPPPQFTAAVGVSTRGSPRPSRGPRAASRSSPTPCGTRSSRRCAEIVNAGLAGRGRRSSWPSWATRRARYGWWPRPTAGSAAPRARCPNAPRSRRMEAAAVAALGADSVRRSARTGAGHTAEDVLRELAGHGTGTAAGIQ